MACKRKMVLLSICSLLSCCTPTVSTESDISCLKSIKASLHDPFDSLSSWDFSNNTQGFICKFVGVECWDPDKDRVISLTLSGMGLIGRFPKGIQNCSSIQVLDLSNNQLEGSIPFDIQNLLYVITLDLSFNKFSGEIPSSIANFAFLNVLNLDHNHLTGRIPPEIGLLPRIMLFSVANNMLSGPVPDFGDAAISADSYANNRGLCGRPLKRCKEHHQAMKFDFSFQSGFAIGYAISAVTIIVVYGSYCVPWVHYGRRNKTMTIAAMIMLMIKQKKKTKEAEFDQFNSVSTVEFLGQMQFVRRMSFEDLSNATNDFSQHNIIGVGEIGTTYKATLPNGSSVAIKKFSQSEEHFITELKTLGKLRHDNLLPLLGFCKESNERLLVYRYISNKNLYDWLHSVEGQKNKNKILEWPLRINIAVGLARALAWLHHSCEFRVAHLRISSKCILLDQNFEPKLSSFGMATMINPKEISASRGFCVDIEFWEECFIKEDVLNFGTVLLELITGENAISLKEIDESLEKLNTDVSSYSSSCVSYLIDEDLIGQGHDREIFQCLKIACTCVHSIPQKRPTMLDVFTALNIIRDGCED